LTTAKFRDKIDFLPLSKIKTGVQIMIDILMFVIGAIAGFIAGMLVYRNNQKKLEQEIKDWDLTRLSEVRKRLMVTTNKASQL